MASLFVKVGAIAAAISASGALVACSSDSLRVSRDAAAVDVAAPGGGGSAGGGTGSPGLGGAGGTDPAREAHLAIINAPSSGAIEIKRPTPVGRYEACSR